MTTENRVKALEDELKLIKSELKQTLVNVRDFMLDLKVPPQQEELDAPERKAQLPEVDTPDSSHPASDESSPAQTPLEQTPHVEGSIGNNSNQYNGTEPRKALPVDTIPLQVHPESNDNNENNNDKFENHGLPPEEDEIISGDFPREKEPGVLDSIAEEVSDMRIGETKPSTSQVNLLANLIRWVARAKKEIGTEQLPVFLDIYAMGGSLAQEMKEVILRLSEVTTDTAIEAKTSNHNELIDENIALCVEINNLTGQLPPEFRDNIRRLTDIIIQQSVRLNKADIWSQLLLELHGILTGGGMSLHLPETNQEGKEEKKLDGVNESEIQENEQEFAGSSFAETTVSESAEETEEQTPEQKGIKPAILRLVMPLEDGSEQELNLGSLFIAIESKPKKSNGHKSVSQSER